MINTYLNSVKRQFEYYKILGEKTFDQLEDDQLFKTLYVEGNSISIIVNHLWGNMLSRWTNFLNEDGEKEWRQRDAEFEPVIKNKKEMIEKWNEGWECLFNALNEVNEANFNHDIFIRNQKHHMIDAINRQVSHYAYHVGQIVVLGRLFKGKDWKSLSIPKGQSQQFNQEKMNKGTHGGHFTDDIK